jgi:hypothetical protein
VDRAASAAAQGSRAGPRTGLPGGSHRDRADPRPASYQPFPGSPRPQPGQTRFNTGSSSAVFASSKYTRCRPPPNTRRTCPHSQRCSALRPEPAPGRACSGGVIRVIPAIGPPPRCSRYRPRPTSARLPRRRLARHRAERRDRPGDPVLWARAEPRRRYHARRARRAPPRHMTQSSRTARASRRHRQTSSSGSARRCLQ